MAIKTEKVGKATLAPAAAASYARMLRAGMPQVGYVNSYRSYAEQERLYKLYLAGKGNLAAKPGKSRHNFGDAMDISTGSAQQRWLAEGDRYDKVGSGKTRANGFGWVRDVPSEPWHFRYVASKDTSRKPTAATRKLQAALNRHGAKLAVDGVYGLASYAALVAFQKSKKLAADGVDGPKTWAALNAAKPKPDAGAIIIVAGSANKTSGKLGAKYRRRLDLALSLLQQDSGLRVIVTGGVKAGRGAKSEAANAAAYLKSEGVAADRILPEDTSGSTHSNFTRALPIAKAAGAKSLIVVSDLSHSRRCLAFAYAADKAKKTGVPISGAAWYPDSSTQDATVSQATLQAKVAWSGMTEAIVRTLDAKWGVV